MAYTTINKSTDNFNTVTYTGNASTNAITGVGFQPDLIWGKDRGGDRHWWVDAVRGKNGTGYSILASNNTEADTGNYPSDGVTAIGSDGFTLGANTSNDYGGWSNEINQNSGTYVAWNWKAGTTSGITQGGASITPTAYSFNQTAGFSIIKYTGGGAVATVPHGLGTTPAVIILRNTTDAENWVVYHHKNTSAPETDYLLLNSNAATTDGNTVWNDVAPTANVFTIGTSGAVSGNNKNHIAYCFAEKKGFSKFGSYTGNGNANGQFVYLGFKPAWVMVKKTSGTANWAINDTKRDFNAQYGNDASIYANTNGAETTSSSLNIDLLSNGMKLRSNNSDFNASGGTYIYMAFGQSLVGSNNIPCTAR